MRQRIGQNIFSIGKTPTDFCKTEGYMFRDETSKESDFKNTLCGFYKLGPSQAFMT